MLHTGFMVAYVRPSIALGVLAMTVANCSLALDFESVQCASKTDCTALGLENAECVGSVCVAQGEGGSGGSGGSAEGGGGSAPDPRWDCLDGFQQPTVEPQEMIEHFYRFEVATALPGTPPQNLAVKVCNQIDVECTTPVDMPTPDANGALTLSLASTFDGFLVVTAENMLTGFVLLQPTVKLPQSEKVIRMIDEPNFINLVEFAGGTYDPMRGVGLVLAVDCQDDRAAEVKLISPDADAQTQPFYFKDGAPNIEETQTDEQGAGGYLNLPINKVIRLEMHRATTDELIGTTSFRARAGAIVYVPLGPTEN